MKKLMLFVLACVALAACKKEKLASDGTFFHKGQEVTISATSPGSDGGSKATGGWTRIRLDSGRDSCYICYNWDLKDSIKVTVGSADAVFHIQQGSEGNPTGKFDGRMPADGDVFTVQYPVEEPNLDSQTFAGDSVVPKDAMLFRCNSATLSGSVDLQMENAILGLDVKNVGSGVKKVKRIVAIVYSEVSGSEVEYELNIRDGFSLIQNVPAMFYIVVTPFTDEKLKVRLFDENEVLITEKNTSSVQTIKKGHCLQMVQIPVGEASSK